MVPHSVVPANVDGRILDHLLLASPELRAILECARLLADGVDRRPAQSCAYVSAVGGEDRQLVAHARKSDARWATPGEKSRWLPNRTKTRAFTRSLARFREPQQDRIDHVCTFDCGAVVPSKERLPVQPARALALASHRGRGCHCSRHVIS